jgi:hypothetical protein
MYICIYEIKYRAKSPTVTNTNILIWGRGRGLTECDALLFYLLHLVCSPWDERS